LHNTRPTALEFSFQARKLRALLFDDGSSVDLLQSSSGDRFFGRGLETLRALLRELGFGSEDGSRLFLSRKRTRDHLGFAPSTGFGLESFQLREPAPFLLREECFEAIVGHVSPSRAKSGDSSLKFVVA